MALKIGIDVGGTFTDFVVTRDGEEPAIFKSLSTPSDPSIAVVNGLTDIAAAVWLLSLSGRRPRRWLRHGPAIQTAASTVAPPAEGRTGTALPGRVRTMPPTAAALMAAVRDWARVRVLWLLLVLVLVFTPANWWAYGLASLLVAVTYAFAGMIVAPLVGRVTAILLAFLIPFVDLGLSQSPMLRAEPEAWAQTLPGYGGMRMLIDASVTSGLDQWAPLASSLAWLGIAAVGAAVVVAVATSRSTRMTDLSS